MRTFAVKQLFIFRYNINVADNSVAKLQFNFDLPLTVMLNSNKIVVKQVYLSIFSINFALNAIKKINDERYKSHKSRVGREGADKQMAVRTVRQESCNNLEMVHQYLTTRFSDIDQGSCFTGC